MKIDWTTQKPEFNEECLLLVATKFRGKYEYDIYQIKKMSTEEEGWYLGWLTGEGDEYGDIADLRADMYCIMPLL